MCFSYAPVVPMWAKSLFHHIESVGTQGHIENPCCQISSMCFYYLPVVLMWLKSAGKVMEFENDIIKSINVLRNGGIILYPTDTIWGIGCDAANAIAIRKIYLLKKREEKKSMIILVAEKNDIKNYVLDPSEKIIDFLSEQKKPTTAIFSNAVNLPGELINKDGSIAIRIVKDDFCQMILKRLNAPLVSTSANISGDDHPNFFKEVNDVIKNGVDYVVQHRQNEMEEYQASSIVRLNSLGEIEKIR